MDGKPLGPAYQAIAVHFEEQRHADACDAVEALAKTDPMAVIYAMGLAEKAAFKAHAAGDRALAKRLADLAVRGAREYASGATSGAEGVALMEDYKQTVRRLSRFR